MEFCKYHALGNDYLVAGNCDLDADSQDVTRVCNRNLGLGSDGILFDVGTGGEHALRIINPDGSEAEKSGNGLRIFARYLWDQGRVKTGSEFQIQTLGGVVTCVVHEDGRQVTVHMGRARLIDESSANGFTELDVGGKSLQCTLISIGNPHCVLFMDPLDPDIVRSIGPCIETHPRFANRTNVQFVNVRDRSNIELEIWERGAGYTLASGSSASAAASAAFVHGYVDHTLTAHMPGGPLSVEIGESLDVSIRGPVVFVATMRLSEEVFSG